MYDVSPDFLNQLAADRRQSLQRTAAASSSRAPLRRRIAASVAQLRHAPVEYAPAPIETQPVTGREHEVTVESTVSLRRVHESEMDPDPE